jgi:hypothetical protein
LSPVVWHANCFQGFRLRASRFEESPEKAASENLEVTMKALKPAPIHDEFEGALIAELEDLRKSEKALQRMYPRLKKMPQLRTVFLKQLADVQQRAHRLDLVLNPVDALQFGTAAASPVNSSVA